jgi:hypothetical protein
VSRTGGVVKKAAPDEAPKHGEIAAKYRTEVIETVR